jgi:hypothetical protein
VYWGGTRVARTEVTEVTEAGRRDSVSVGCRSLIPNVFKELPVSPLFLSLTLTLALTLPCFADAVAAGLLP